MLSPRREAIDLEFGQFRSMLAAECWRIGDGSVFEALGQAIVPFCLKPLPQHEFAAFLDFFGGRVLWTASTYQSWPSNP